MSLSRTLRTCTVGAFLALTVLTSSVAAPADAAPAGPSWPSTMPAHVFVPYFQSYQPGDPAALAAAAGARYLTMAFLQTQTTGSCQVLWNGDPQTPVSQSVYGASFAKIKALGGAVAASFGGGEADGDNTDIADSCTDVDAIAAAYENVVTTYGITRLDLDVEGDSLNNTAGIDRRNKAIHQVESWAERTGRTVQFVYTIPTNTNGLDPNGVGVLANAVADHAAIDIVNIMTFDYYDNLPHEMAADTVTAADALVATLRTLYPARTTRQLWQMVGITEMIGADDYGSDGETGPAEIFTPADSVTVTRWAWQHDIGELSFWGLARDNGNCPGVRGADNCSGVVQTPWQYTQTMSTFTHGW